MSDRLLETERRLIDEHMKKYAADLQPPNHGRGIIRFFKLLFKRRPQ